MPIWMGFKAKIIRGSTLKRLSGLSPGSRRTGSGRKCCHLLTVTDVIRAIFRRIDAQHDARGAWLLWRPFCRARCA